MGLANWTKAMVFGSLAWLSLIVRCGTTAVLSQRIVNVQWDYGKAALVSY